MKILGVKFKNINSLTGEWEIRFDQSPISDTGLFAIVGPNGSGKSSILDAITLGLYGETARLGIPEPGMLNPQGKESYAEVTFSVLDHCYCSRWSIAQATETPAVSDMSLFSLNGDKTLMESRSIPVRNRIAELTGLDFKRFCRSILLTQGDFSAFLHALDSERAEILEKIIGPEMLSEMETSIRTQAERETDRLHRLKEEAAGFPTPDKGRESEIRQSMEQAEEEIHIIDRDMAMLRDMESWLERMTQDPDAHQRAAEALRLAETQYAEARSHYERIEQARPAGSFREGLTQLELLKARAETIQEQIRQQTAQTPDEADRLSQLETRLADIRRELAAAGQLLTERSEDLSAAASLDRDIAEIEALFLKTVTRLEAIAREQRDTVRMQSEQEDKERQCEARMAELGQWIESNDADAALDAEIPVIESLLNQIVTSRQEIETNRKLRITAIKDEERSVGRLQSLEAAVLKIQDQTDILKARRFQQDGRLQAIYGGETKAGLKTAIERSIQELAACKHLVRIARKASSFKNVPDELAEYQARMDSLTESVSSEQSRLQALEDQIHQRNTIRRFDAERSALEQGKPCPLCGASHHPFLEAGMLDFSELDDIVREREERIRGLETERAVFEKKAQNLLSRNSVLESFRNEWSERCAAVDHAWDFGDSTSPKERIDAVRHATRVARSKIRSAWWVSWRVRWTDRRLTRKNEALAKRRYILDQALEQNQSHRKETARIDAELILLEERANTARVELGHRLERLLETLPEPGQELQPVERLQERLDNYRSKIQARNSVADELLRLRSYQQSFSEIRDQLQAESEILTAEGETLQRKLTTLKADRESRYGVLDPGAERRELESRIESLASEEMALSRELDSLRVRLAADREALERMHHQLQDIRQEAETAERILLEQSSAAGFDTMDAIREEISVLQGESEISRLLADADAARTAARQSLADLEPKHPTEDSLETVQWKISDALKRLQERTQEIDSGERILEQYRQTEREYRELLQAIAVQEKVCDEAVAVRNALKAQGDSGTNLHHILMQQLLDETNRHLTALSSGRYTLKPSGENGLGLHIEDALQSGEQRPVKTLSGGESFLVSLCLALGLSNMAAQRHKIDSLFLDEGFGALDDEMLYKVMAALKNLRADGKTVGIVSHVKRLAQEIPTQIRLEKEPGGSSRLMVVA